MHAVLTEQFFRQLLDSPPDVQRRFLKQVALLLRDPRHPSLQVKKLNEREERYQARVTLDWRFYYYRQGDAYHMVGITPHPK